MGHLEDPKLTADLTVARDFDLGMTGPPLFISMDFIAGGLVEHDRRPRLCARAGCAYAWWAPLVLAGAWLATHWLLRESAVWRDRNTDEVRTAQRDAEYAYRLAVDPPASKELRLFGLVGLDDRSVRRPPDAAARAAVRSDAPARASGGVEPVARHRRQRASSSGRSPMPPPSGRINLGAARDVRPGARRHIDDRVRRAQLGAGWGRGAGRGGAAPRSRRWRRPARLPSGDARPTGHAAREIRFRNVTFAYPGGAAGARRTSISRFRPARRSRSSARTAPARPRSPSCCAGCTTRSRARSRSTASTCASSISTQWRVAAGRRVPGLHPLRAAAARQRRARRRAGRGRARRP